MFKNKSSKLHVSVPFNRIHDLAIIFSLSPKLILFLSRSHTSLTAHALHRGSHTIIFHSRREIVTHKNFHQTWHAERKVRTLLCWQSRLYPENEWSKAIAIDCEVMCRNQLRSLIYRSFFLCLRSRSRTLSRLRLFCADYLLIWFSCHGKSFLLFDCEDESKKLRILFIYRSGERFKAIFYHQREITNSFKHTPKKNWTNFNQKSIFNLTLLGNSFEKFQVCDFVAGWKYFAKGQKLKSGIFFKLRHA